MLLGEPRVLGFDLRLVVQVADCLEHLLEDLGDALLADVAEVFGDVSHGALQVLRGDVECWVSRSYCRWPG